MSWLPSWCGWRKGRELPPEDKPVMVETVVRVETVVMETAVRVEMAVMVEKRTMQVEPAVSLEDAAVQRLFDVQ